MTDEKNERRGIVAGTAADLDHLTSTLPPETKIEDLSKLATGAADKDVSKSVIERKEEDNS
jgi:hypothetical protein